MADDSPAVEIAEAQPDPTPAPVRAARPVASSAPPPVVAAETVIPLDQWCMIQSGKDRKPELLAAFRHVELAAGHTKDTPDAFAARYAAVASRPTI